MKLRNKRTGEILDIDFIYPDTAEYFRPGYKLKDFTKEWEDYKPAEPLIKDEKIRKAVRAWAEAEYIPLEATVYYNSEEYSFGYYRTMIEFSQSIEGLEEKEYDITELCGEEEE